MKAVAQDEIISLIADLNSFADRAERLISTTQSTYDKNKKNLLTKHSSELSSLEFSYKSSCSAVSQKAHRTISEAKKILSEIDKLDDKLSKVDKYYVKTKKKKEESLSEITSEKYSEATDYFGALEKIKADFDVLFKKYSEDILPGLINGINYLFSSKRKKDYEELIILRNTVCSFVREIEEMLPPITEEQLIAIKQDYQTKRSSLLKRNESELNNLENGYSKTLEDVADQIYTELDDILPDEFVDYLSSISSFYTESINKVNTTVNIQNEVLNMMFVSYPVDFLVQSPIVASVIKEKCSKLLYDDGIRFPVIISTSDAPVWLVSSDGSNATVVQAFIHSIMFGFLSSCPVAHLTYKVVDPENRGNSIFPFFDAKKKLPELFGEKIIISKDDITQLA